MKGIIAFVTGGAAFAAAMAVADDLHEAALLGGATAVVMALLFVAGAAHAYRDWRSIEPIDVTQSVAPISLSGWWLIEAVTVTLLVATILWAPLLAASLAELSVGAGTGTLTTAALAYQFERRRSIRLLARTVGVTTGKTVAARA